jgi:flagellar biosynthesis GTPase FlhF
MQLHTFTARSLPEALRLIRQTLGPDASLLHTRDVTSSLGRWLGRRTIEVTATDDGSVPSRLGFRPDPEPGSLAPAPDVPARDLHDYRRLVRESLQTSAIAESSLVERLADGPRARDARKVLKSANA